MMPDPLLTLDVAHPPMAPDRVEEVLQNALTHVRNTASLRILKVVHGYGSRGGAGTTRTVVRNWAYRHRGRVRAVIDGETYGLGDPDTIALRTEVGMFPDSDLGIGNPGITLLWVR